MLDNLNQKEPAKQAQNFPVVGIGASAGGLEALKKLIHEIPADSGMAYVVVQHLSPDYDSNLPELLSQVSKIPVFEIINDINLAPNTLYIIPENSILTATDGVLKLAQRDRHAKRNMAIDIFFKSLAEVHQSFAIGVVLSGMAFDGTDGLKVIREVGGVTIAQSPETAAFKGMPQSAIDADIVDYILAPEKIPAQLIHIRNSYQISKSYSEDDQLPESEEEIISQIIKLVFVRTGNDFRHYKQATIRRRIARRMVITKKIELSDYYNHLRNDKSEQDAMFNDFVIPVSYFFRDSKIFEKLTTEIFPKLIENKTGRVLRIWVAGCSTGEEAYSLAICLHEFISEKVKEDIRIQIFASDISEKAIAKARTALYNQQDVQHVSESRLNNYFTKRDGYYSINQVIRDMCIFAVHNFIKDPPFAKIDLVSCRNVLIYLDNYLQTKVLTSFHYALRENAILFLGKSETVGNVPNLFEPIGKQEKFYLRKFAPSRYVPEVFKPVHYNRDKHEKEIEEKRMSPEIDFRKTASDLLFANYTPAGVVINNLNDIIHFHGDTSPFLLASPGKPNFNILKMAREGIEFELRNAISSAREKPQNVIKENIKVKNQTYLVSIEIVPLKNTNNYLLILFKLKEVPVPDEDVTDKKKSADRIRIKELEDELVQLREDIKRVTEEQQTAYEELQTTNEELLSSSEELQALNEELETSAEELQSNNEELMCVNDELLDRQDQLISLRNYSESIVKTIREPLIILDKNFVVKSGNPAFYKFFRTTEQETEGRSLFEIGNGHWDIPELRDSLVRVLPEKTNIEDLLVDTIIEGIGRKVMLVNARKVSSTKPTDLILLAIEDTTDITSANSLLTSKNNELMSLNDQMQKFGAAASHDLQEPLRKIFMFSNQILDSEKALSDSGRHSLSRIITSIESMRKLIEDLIYYTQISVVEKDFKRTDLNILLKKTLFDLKNSVTERNAVVKIFPLPHLNVNMSQMQTVFSHLLQNSILYTKDDVIPEIKIESEQCSVEEIQSLGGNPDTNYIKITVSDNGKGFNAVDAQRIFEPFHRLHSKEKYGGSGLGLTITRKIISSHGGFIFTTSTVGEGTKISVILPMSM